MIFFESNSIEILAILAFGFFGSLGHCIGMCGGFIISYTSSKIDPNSSKTAQALGHSFYNIGRIFSYTILGALFGYFGSLWDATPFMRMIMFGFAGFFMILMGLSLSGYIKFSSYLEYPIAQTTWFKKIFLSQLNSNSKRSFFTLGALNGLLPCGLVYTMLISAIATKSLFLGALILFLFGLSTIPTLFSFGFLYGFISKNNFRHIMLRISSLIIIVFGFWTLYKSYSNFELYKAPLNSNVIQMKCGSGKCGVSSCH